MNNPSEAQKVVLRRDKYQCQVCGVQDRYGAFDVDHIKPLFEANGDHSYWQTPNLRTLCKPCHKDKTREDMQRYYAARAALKDDKSGTSCDPQTADPDPETPAAQPEN
ncbi:HNH endonuclease [compost metagenome]